jgi:hypothetical protein
MVQIEQMAEPLLFGFQIGPVMLMGGQFMRNALGHGNTVPFEVFHLFGIVCSSSA